MALPVLPTDEDAERCIDKADLSEDDLSGFEPMHFKFAPKDGRVSMRLRRDLLAEVKTLAKCPGMPYQR